MKPAHNNQVSEVESKDERIKAVLDDVTSLQKVKPVPTYFLIIRKLLCCASQKKKGKPIDMAESRLDAHLDIVNIIKSQMMQTAVLRTHFTKVERHLARRQYDSRVLDPDCANICKSDSDSESEQSVVNKYLITEDKEHKFFEQLT